MASDRDVARHTPVTQAVHENDGAIVMQILHSGRYIPSLIRTLSC
jgi:2,4-dienoyl-CoA reductase (NADPH2)